MNEITITALSGTVIAILFSIIVFFLKQLLTKVDLVYDFTIAQREINKNIFARMERIEKEMSGL